jgi:IclR family pca regulon transcriptional regulator
MSATGGGAAGRGGDAPMNTSPAEGTGDEKDRSRDERGGSAKRSADLEYVANIRRVPDPHLSRSMEYGAAVLECFSGERVAIGVSALAEMIGMSRSGAYRHASTLVALGFLEQDGRHRYRLSHGAAEAGMSVLGVIAARSGSRAILAQLRDQTGHTASLGVLDGQHVTYVQRAHGHRRGQYEADMGLGAGAHAPTHCSALGKAMLASLPEERLNELLGQMTLTRMGPSTITTKHDLLGALAAIKTGGLAVSDEEHAGGVRSIAVALSDRVHQQTLAVEVTAPAAAYTLEQLMAHAGPQVRRAAGCMATRLAKPAEARACPSRARAHLDRRGPGSRPESTAGSLPMTGIGASPRATTPAPSEREREMRRSDGEPKT